MLLRGSVVLSFGVFKNAFMVQDPGFLFSNQRWQDLVFQRPRLCVPWGSRPCFNWCSVPCTGLSLHWSPDIYCCNNVYMVSPGDLFSGCLSSDLRQNPSRRKENSTDARGETQSIVANFSILNFYLPIGLLPFWSFLLPLPEVSPLGSFMF